VQDRRRARLVVVNHLRVAVATTGCALGLLWPAGTSATASGSQWVWPKSWAVSQLLKKFPGTTTVCDPVGPPTRERGYNAYAEFACVVGLSSSRSYVLVIKPRSRAAWTTLKIEKTSSPPSGGTPPARPGATTHAPWSVVGSSHRLADASLDGSRLTLDDGTTWLVSPPGQHETVLWSWNDPVVVLKGGTPGYPYPVLDTARGSSVVSRLLAQP